MLIRAHAQKLAKTTAELGTKFGDFVKSTDALRSAAKITEVSYDYLQLQEVRSVHGVVGLRS